jgi:hypothetical protein
MAESPEDGPICPITFQHVVVPMMSVSGHIYEREAITRWVNEHGTSPLTRQPLRLDQLISDENTPMIFNPIEELPEPNYSQSSPPNPARPLVRNPARPLVRNPARPLVRNSQDFCQFKWFICCAAIFILYIIIILISLYKKDMRHLESPSDINTVPSTLGRFVLMEIYFESLLKILFTFNNK